jgi:hypothetical protein
MVGEPRAVRAGRKIVLLSDGTGNSSAKVWRTNVWRVFESLDLSGDDQVAFYDDGVGTSSFKPLAVLGGAFGYGLKRNVIDLYKFACRNYRHPDDEIYGFGFSRGAFTIRTVIGLILEQGLVTADSEQELNAKAKAAYRTFRRANFHTYWYVAVQWILRRANSKRPEPKPNNVNVRFLGLWDTVAAYGMPVVEANPQSFGHPVTVQDKDGRIYDPRSGLGGYYRYGPRNLLELGKDLLSRKGGEALPRIHESVLKRMHSNAQSYAPKGLPARYEVVTEAGEVLAPYQTPPGRAKPYETEDQAKARWNCQERVWNTIWWRRIVYFVTVAVSLYLVIFPLLRALPSYAELESPLRWVSDVVETAGAFLPSAATPWITGYARAPGQFLLVGALLTITLLWGSWLAARIQNRMGISWQQSLNSKLVDPGKPDDLIYRLRTSPVYIAMHTGLKIYVAPALFAFLFAYLGLTLSSHVLFNIWDDAGWVCRETKTQLANLDSGDILLASGKPAKLSELAEKAKTNPLLSPSDKKNPFKYVEDLPVFTTSELCQSMGVKLERNGKYLVQFESTNSFSDWNGRVNASLGYYSTGEKDMSIWRKALMIALVPLRRELIRPWFRVVARFGGKGGEETFLDPDVTDKFVIDEPIKATRDGELFLFVNDAVIGIPGFHDRFYKYFYKDNRGATKVAITRQ